MAKETKCPVCSEQAMLAESYRGGMIKLNCPRCGRFDIGDLSSHEISNWSKRQLANLAGWIREHPKCSIRTPDLKGLAGLRTPSVGEKAQKLLEQFASMSPKPGSAVDISIQVDPSDHIAKASRKVSKEFLTKMAPNAGWAGVVHPQFLAWSWSEDFEELAYLIKEFLISETKAISLTPAGDLVITPKGWAQLDSIRLEKSRSQIGFIAMWFDKSVDPAHAAIDLAVRSAGYEPLRIDRKEHNNKIDDEIVAGIRRCKFLVADFTGHRGGVYFEAGLAIGLGLPVIWLCRKDELEKTHFDTRQYNFVLWEDSSLPELSKALQNRIEATIGRGPLAASA